MTDDAVINAGGTSAPLAPSSPDAALARTDLALAKVQFDTEDQAAKGVISRKEADTTSATIAETSYIDSVFPPGKPHEYEMPPYRNDNPETLAFDKQARGWLSSARFTREHGAALAREVDRVSAKFAAMDAPTRELYRIKERQTLERLWGDKTPERIGLARQLLEEIDAKSPGILEGMDRSGAGNSALVISLLHAQAERLLMRPEKK